MPQTNYPRILQEKRKGTRTPIGTGEQKCYICKEVTEVGKWVMDMTRRPFVVKWKCDKDKNLCFEIRKRKELEMKLSKLSKEHNKLEQNSKENKNEISKFKKVLVAINFSKKVEEFEKNHSPLIKKNWQLKNQLENQRFNYLTQTAKWWFKPGEEEKNQLEQAENTKILEEVWKQANHRRNFWTSGLLIAFLSLIFLSWNKFWTW